MSFLSALPVSHLITEENWKDVPGIDILQFRGRHSDGFVSWPHVDSSSIYHSSYDGAIQGVDREELEKIRDNGHVTLFSLNLGSAVEKVLVKNGEFVADGKILYPSEIRERVRRAVSVIREYYQGLIALENGQYVPNNSCYYFVAVPELIKKIIEENNLYFCLDIAHAMIAANNMKEDKAAYICRLPIERCLEIHISTPASYSWKLVDVHGYPDSRVKFYLEWVLRMLKGKMNPYVVVEYYRDFEGIRKAYRELQELKGNMNDQLGHHQ
jgi:uncharacterized protein (UPF0276 family)